MDAQKLFRKQALEKLASPERLDELMAVTSPAAWLALTALGLVLVGLVAWSFIGEISTKVSGQGILVAGGELQYVTASSGGEVAEVLVREGEPIDVDDVIARVSMAGTQQELESAQGKLVEEEEKAEAIAEAASERIVQLTDELEERQRALSKEEDLRNRGLSTDRDVTNAQAEVTRVQSQIDAQNDRLVAQQSAVSDQRRKVELILGRLSRESEIKSLVRGRVIEVIARPGEKLEPNGTVIALEQLDSDIEAVLLVPASDGKRIEVGQEARVLPSTTKAEEFGFIRGTVSYAGRFPVTPSRLRSMFRNDQLVQDLAGRSSALELRVKLTPDASTDSGFEWTSSDGPPTPIYTGTLCSARVTVERRRPISYVIPWLRGLIGKS